MGACSQCGSNLTDVTLRENGTIRCTECGAVNDLREAIETLWSEAAGADALPDVTIRATVMYGPSDTLDSPSRTATISDWLKLRPQQVAESVVTAELPPHYELLERLGEGGMGVVYRAKQTSADRTIALKLIKGSYEQNSRHQSGFLSEAVATANLDHPNIIPVYDVGAKDDGTIFYAMKEVRGTEWKSVIQEKSQSENLDILMRVADAVAFAHSRGVIHRDLKPENIMLGDFGEVLVMDWGLAVSVTPEGKADRLDPEHAIGGTPSYMSPEMAMGDEAKIGTASDVYLLGSILFEIATGKRPHVGDTAVDCLINAAENRLAETDANGELIDIALKAMSTEPEQRHESVKSLQTDLRQALEHVESIQMTDAAVAGLDSATLSDGPDMHRLYTEAIVGFQQAIGLWEGNDDARRGLQRAREQFAEAALSKGDLALAEGQIHALDAECATGLQDTTGEAAPPEVTTGSTADLADRIRQAIKERAKRARIAKYSKLGAVAAVALIAVVSIAAYLVTDKARRAAEKARAEEEQQRLLVQKEKEAAEKARDAEAEQRKAAVAAQRSETEQRRIAEENLAIAERENYYNTIALARIKIDECLVEQAQDILWNTPKTYRHYEWGRLLIESDTSLMTIPRSYTPAVVTAWSPDSRKLLTGHGLGTLRIWDADTGTELIKMSGHVKHKAIRYISWSRDGKSVLSLAQDGAVKVWNAETGKELLTINDLNEAAKPEGYNPGRGKHPDSLIQRASWTSDGNLICTSDAYCTVKLWNVRTGKELRSFQYEIYPHVNDVSISPDGKRIATAHIKECGILNIETGHKLKAPATAYALSWSPNGKYIVTTENTGDPMVIDATEGKIKHTLRGHPVPPRYAAWSPDSKQIVTSGDDRSVRIWDVETGTQVRTLRGHTSSAYSPSWSPDGKRIASASGGGVKIWDAQVRGGTVPLLHIGRYPARASFGVWSPDGKIIATQDASRQMKTCDPETGGVLFTTRDSAACNFVGAALISPDGSKVVTTKFGTKAKIVDARTGKHLLTLDGDSEQVNSSTWSPDSTKVAIAAHDRAVIVWDAIAGRELCTIELADYTGWPVEWAPDSKKFLTLWGKDRNSATVWDAETGDALLTFDCKSSRGLWSAGWSPDGSKFLVGVMNAPARVFDAQNGKLLFKCEGRSSRITAAMWSPDTTKVIAGNTRTGINVWNAKTGKRAITLEGHTESIFSVKWSPDGKRIVTGSSDKTARLWDSATGRELLALDDFSDSVTVLTWSPDGRSLLAGGGMDVNMWEAVPWDEISTRKQYDQWRKQFHHGWLARHREPQKRKSARR